MLAANPLVTQNLTEKNLTNSLGDDRHSLFSTDGDTEPQWSPEGHQIVFTGYRNGNLEI